MLPSVAALFTLHYPLPADQLCSLVSPPLLDLLDVLNANGAAATRAEGPRLFPGWAFPRNDQWLTVCRERKVRHTLWRQHFTTTFYTLYTRLYKVHDTVSFWSDGYLHDEICCEGIMNWWLDKSWDNVMTHLETCCNNRLQAGIELLFYIDSLIKKSLHHLSALQAPCGLFC